MGFVGSQAPELEADTWINSAVELDEGDYLVNFWRYTCLDCLADARKLEELSRVYPVEPVGVHLPEFGFESRPENLEKALERHGIGYPVATGQDLRKKYRSTVPGNVLVRDGSIAWKGTGRENMEQLEQAIAEELGTENRKVVETRDRRDSSPDRRFGLLHGEKINDSFHFRGEKEFSAPAKRKINSLYLDGRWQRKEEYIQAREGARLLLPFHGSEAGIVADPSGSIKDIEIRLDGEKIPYRSAGEDVPGTGSYVRARNPGLFQVIDGQYRRGELELRPEKNTRLYSITFR